MQSRELLLKDSQFVLDFRALCAKTAVSLILDVMRVYHDQKKINVF